MWWRNHIFHLYCLHWHFYSWSPNCTSSTLALSPTAWRPQHWGSHSRSCQGMSHQRGCCWNARQGMKLYSAIVSQHPFFGPWCVSFQNPFFSCYWIWCKRLIVFYSIGNVYWQSIQEKIPVAPKDNPPVSGNWWTASSKANGTTLNKLLTRQTGRVTFLLNFNVDFTRPNEMLTLWTLISWFKVE